LFHQRPVLHHEQRHARQTHLFDQPGHLAFERVERGIVDHLAGDHGCVRAVGGSRGRGRRGGGALPSTVAAVVLAVAVVDQVV
jgi:hypothetical protein